MIIDVNVAHKVLLADDDPDFGPVRRGLLPSPRAYIIMVYGGQLFEEYAASPALLRMVRLLDQAGRARQVDGGAYEKALAEIVALDLCISNDSHIIALARAGGVRLLCSLDAALHADFTNQRLLNRPRGKVYQTHSHRDLLRAACR